MSLCLSDPLYRLVSPEPVIGNQNPPRPELLVKPGPNTSPRHYLIMTVWCVVIDFNIITYHNKIPRWDKRKRKYGRIFLDRMGWFPVECFNLDINYSWLSSSHCGYNCSDQLRNYKKGKICRSCLVKPSLPFQVKFWWIAGNCNIIFSWTIFW